MDPRIEKLAKVLVHYSAEVKPGDLVWLRYDKLSEEAALAIHREVLEAGGNPVPMPYIDRSRFEVQLHRLGSDEQLEFLNPVLEWLINNADVRISVGAPEHTKAFASISGERMAQRRKVKQPILEAFMRRQSSGEFRWTGTLLPTMAGAQDAEMSFEEYREFVFNAGMLHLDDPVSYWKQKSEEQARLIEWLKGRDVVKLNGPNIDMTLSIKGRTFINADGKRNFPDGEIFTGPVEDSVNGWVHFTYPAVYSGREVNGVQLRFQDGRVVEATADKGEDYLLSVLDTDEGARTLGEFAIGTNEQIQQFTRSILFDEKIGGTVHMAVGMGYPDTGSQNKSAVHWDMICDMREDAEIVVDGDLLYKNGEFQI